jgi:signal transduction histidine kinase
LRAAIDEDVRSRVEDLRGSVADLRTAMSGAEGLIQAVSQRVVATETGLAAVQASIREV